MTSKIRAVNYQRGEVMIDGHIGHLPEYPGTVQAEVDRLEREVTQARRVLDAEIRRLPVGARAFVLLVVRSILAYYWIRLKLGGRP